MTTMREVAERAGVSIATVSFLVNDTKPIAPATRERIETAMAELGFRRNVMARALASRRSRILALAYPALQHKLGSTAAEFVAGAAREARKRDYHLVLWPVSNQADELSELVGGGLADGVLLMEVLLDDPRVPVLQRARLPFALIGRTVDPSGLDYVDIDFDQSLITAVDHLQSLGHQRFALVQEGPLRKGFRSYGPKRRTRQVFRRLAKERGLDITVAECGPSATKGRQAATRLVTDDADVTAVLVQNDHAAAGVVSGLQAAGRKVPADISVMSLLTSIDVGTMADPVLTMMRTPGAELGQLGVQHLIDQVEGRPVAEPELMPCLLTPGMSTGPVPS